MKLEIKLKDPKYCDGCPVEIRWGGCAKYGRLKLTKPLKHTMVRDYIRPKQCIKENGK